MADGALPSGTLTCVFSDIEGSTRMFRAIGDAYVPIQSRHDTLLREVWGGHGGVVVKSLGDGFLVVFAEAPQALAAAAAAQRALNGLDWPDGSPVRVRMGMHRGYARPTGDDYTALVVNQAARVTGAARGGQVLLTAEVATAAVADGAPDVRLQPLGRFRVRDFDEPIALFGVAGPGIPVIDAPPRVRPADGHNLVRPSTSLVGRGDDADRLTQLVGPGRVTTLVGPGGVGKTRLATELAIATAGSWADGAWFVDLAPLGEDPLVGEAIGDTVGAPGTPGAERWPEVLEHLAERRMLVVLDNCEHLAAASGRAAAEIVASCPGVAVLATSRMPLGLRGERVHRLPPLGEASAAELFLERSGAVDADADVVGALCAELDGLPLAIELAAARAATLPPEEILRQIRRSPAVLRSRDPTLPARQRSLERLLDWGWELLPPPARAVLARLSVFAGSFDVDAAETVGAGGGLEAADVAEALWTLIDASLVRLDETAGETRYRLLTTVRAYAAAHAEQEDLATATRRLAELLLDRIGPERSASRSWVMAMQLELDNAREAAARVDAPAAAHALAWSIGRVHDLTDHFAVGIAEVTRFLETHTAAVPERVALLTLLADLHLHRSDLEGAEPIVAAAETLARDVGVASWDDAGIARTRIAIHLRRGEPEQAARVARVALDDVSSLRGRARLHSMLGVALAESGDARGAAAAFEEELRCAVDAGIETFLPNAHANLAETLLGLGDEQAAAHHQQIALALGREHDLPVTVAFSLMIAARLVAATGGARDAVVLQTRADGLLADVAFELYEHDRRVRAQLLADWETALGREAFAAAVAAGHDISRDAAADLAEEILRSVVSATATTGGS